jgi:hypothetical protein
MVHVLKSFLKWIGTRDYQIKYLFLQQRTQLYNNMFTTHLVTVPDTFCVRVWIIVGGCRSGQPKLGIKPCLHLGPILVLVPGVCGKFLCNKLKFELNWGV